MSKTLGCNTGCSGRRRSGRRESGPRTTAVRRGSMRMLQKLRREVERTAASVLAAVVAAVVAEMEKVTAVVNQRQRGVVLAPASPAPPWETPTTMPVSFHAVKRRGTPPYRRRLPKRQRRPSRADRQRVRSPPATRAPHGLCQAGGGRTSMTPPLAIAAPAVEPMSTRRRGGVRKPPSSPPKTAAPTSAFWRGGVDWQTRSLCPSLKKPAERPMQAVTCGPTGVCEHVRSCLGTPA